MKALWLWLLLTAGVFAQEHQPLVTAWLGDGNLLPDATVTAALADIQKVQAQPEHIVVLVHGYNVVREDGAAQFQEVADRLVPLSGPLKHNLVVLGLQWDSAAPGAQSPWSAEEAYLEKVTRARAVGHLAARQLLLAVQKQFPRAYITVLAHSLGCEVSVGALFPEITYADELPKSESFEPAQELFLNMLCLTGSDLDYDCWYKGGIIFRAQNPRARLLWMTVSPYVRGGRDRTLQIRQMTRGMAGGSAFPRMTEQQYDFLFKYRAIFFDQKDIPEGHEFVNYLSADRLTRMLSAAVYLTDPNAERPQEIDDIYKVLALANKVEEFLPWLDHPNVSGQLYALWRLEALLCGGSQHLADQTLDNVTRLLRNTPRKVWGERESSPCQSVRRAYWPSEALMNKAGAPAWSRD
ncbi:alpha/beta hydrolase [bacterium]|nr:alpha/beta hydrolase [bacterium]